MANQLTRYATVATVDTAGEGYFVGVAIGPVASSAGVMSSGVTETRVFPFVLPFKATIRNITTEVTTGGAAGKKYSVGLYDADKNQVLTSGTIDAEAIAVTTTSITAVTLEPGVYWQAQTTDDNATQFRRILSDLSPFTLINDATDVIGLANASSAGVLPATLGTITGSTGRLPMYVIFSP